MRVVGLKVLKNRLAEYARMTAAGERVLVTARDHVVAELIAPARRHAGDGRRRGAGGRSAPAGVDPGGAAVAATYTRPPEATMLKRCMLLLTAATLLGCSNGADDTQGGRADMTQRQRDSTIAESRLPGAGAVGKALEASDAAAARAVSADSVR